MTLALTLVLGATACTSESATEPTPATETGSDSTPEPVVDPAKQLVDSKCSLCHTLDRVYDATKTRDEWVTTVDRMKSNGLVVSDDEYTTIVDFLAGQ